MKTATSMHKSMYGIMLERVLIWQKDHAEQYEKRDFAGVFVIILCIVYN